MSERTRRFIRYVLPAIVYMAAIFTVSSIPKLYPPSLGITWSDKIYHFIEYAGFSLLLYRALCYWEWSRITVRRLLLVLLLGAVTGAVDELHQLYISGRVAQTSDWIADFAGAVFATVLILLFLLTSRLRRGHR
jgi:VanZ family protein